MKPHVERMVNEQKELCEKIEKLGAFISENPIFDTLAKEERRRLTTKRVILTLVFMSNEVLIVTVKKCPTFSFPTLSQQGYRTHSFLYYFWLIFTTVSQYPSICGLRTRFPVFEISIPSF